MTIPTIQNNPNSIEAQAKMLSGMLCELTLADGKTLTVREPSARRGALIRSKFIDYIKEKREHMKVPFEIDDDGDKMSIASPDGKYVNEQFHTMFEMLVDADIESAAVFVTDILNSAERDVDWVLDNLTTSQLTVVMIRFLAQTASLGVPLRTK